MTTIAKQLKAKVDAIPEGDTERTLMRDAVSHEYLEGASIVLDYLQRYTYADGSSLLVGGAGWAMGALDTYTVRLEPFFGFQEHQKNAWGESIGDLVCFDTVEQRDLWVASRPGRTAHDIRSLPEDYDAGDALELQRADQYKNRAWVKPERGPWRWEVTDEGL